MAGAWQKQNRKQYVRKTQLGLCRRCGKKKPKPKKTTCTACTARQLTWYEKNKKAILASQKKYVDGLREAAFLAYGGYHCACCKETHREFLTLDHIDGNGSSHRRLIGKGSFTLYLWLKRNGYPEGFRILCMNCNFSYGVRGYCPHSKKR